MPYLLVFLGGGLGSILRWYLSSLNVLFPYGTLLANALSSLVLGILLSISLNNDLTSNYRLLLMTGFCGGFSTFSTFSGEIFQFLKAAQYSQAIVYLLVSIFTGLLCVAIGFVLQKTMS